MRQYTRSLTGPMTIFMTIFSAQYLSSNLSTSNRSALVPETLCVHFFYLRIALFVYLNACLSVLKADL